MALVGATLAAGCSGADQPSAATAEVTPTSSPPPASVSTTDPGALAETSPSSAAPAVELPVFEPSPIEWERFNDAIDVGTLEVPVDYANPDGERYELFLARYNALDPDDKIGTLLVNPGGPGYGGTPMALDAADRFDLPLRERFDIIGWDPRGTGESDPAIDCIDSFDPLFAESDSTPDSDAERAVLVDLAEQFAASCVEKNPTLPFVGTNNSARDIDVIRRAVGEETISFFGFSYGSELGATWATLFPDTVRALVVDGAVDPNTDGLDVGVQQLRGFESTLSTFLAECSAEPSCEFHNDGDAESAFDALMAELDATPLPSADGRPAVNRDVARVAVTAAMYAPFLWPSLAKSLAEAQQGEGSGLLALFDAYYHRQPDGTWGNELEAFQSIVCMDQVERPTVAESDAEVERFVEAAPRLVPPGSAGDYMCTFFPPSIDPRVAIDAAGAGPVVVIATTGDPATPLAGTRAMSEALQDGRLVLVTADQHTGYGVNRCVVDVVNDFLIDLEPPADETACE